MGSSYLENLQSNGIVSYNPDTYINTGKQTFSAESQIGSGLTAPMNTGIEKDTFEKNNDRPSQNTIKNFIAGVIAVTLTVIAGVKIRTANALNIFNADGKKSKSIFSRAKDRIASVFKHENQDTKVDNVKNTEKTIDDKKAASKLMERIKNLPKKVKIIGGSVLGLIGLYGIYSLIENRNKNNTQTH